MLGVSQPETHVNRVRGAHLPPTTSRRVILSVNRRAGARWRQRAVADIESALATAGYDVAVIADLGELAELSASATGRGLRAVLAVGGDGTASSVRNRVPLDVPIVPVPLGTENLLARYVGQAATGLAVRETLDRGVVIRLDLGRANGRYFLLMVSVGFDAEVIRRLNENRRGNITRGTYLKPTLETIRSYSYPELQLYCGPDGAAFEKPFACRWLFGFNLPLYALGWQLAPQADGTDGLFDVCTFERGSLKNGLRYLMHVLLRRHLKLADAALVRQRRFRVEAAGAEGVAYQLDGDFAGVLPVDVEVLPGELRLLVSRATAVRLGFGIERRIT